MQLTLRPVPPFDFDLRAQIFSSGDGQIQKYENGKCWQGIRAKDRLILAVVKSLGTADFSFWLLLALFTVSAAMIQKQLMTHRPHNT